MTQYLRIPCFRLPNTQSRSDKCVNKPSRDGEGNVTRKKQNLKSISTYQEKRNWKCSCFYPLSHNKRPPKRTHAQRFHQRWERPIPDCLIARMNNQRNSKCKCNHNARAPWPWLLDRLFLSSVWFLVQHCIGLDVKQIQMSMMEVFLQAAGHWLISWLSLDETFTIFEINLHLYSHALYP